MSENCNKYSPIIIPKGKDGKSVCIAFAEDGEGNGFSFVQTDTSTHISIITCNSNCTCENTLSQSDFTNWIKLTGENGQNAPTIQETAISNGVTLINGELFPVNHLIIVLSDGTTVDSGAITFDLNWIDLPLINGWSEALLSTVETKPQYAIDAFGFLHFRGIIDATSATNAIFSTAVVSLFSVDKRSCIYTEAPGSGNNNVTGLFIDPNIGNSMRIVDYSAEVTEGRTEFYLETVPPIYIV